MNIRKEVLNAADAAVSGDRQLNYGNPESNFARIAELWNAWAIIRNPIIQRQIDTGVILHTSVDVAVFLILVKLARLANSPSHRDSWIDIAGYAACGAEVAEESKP